MHKGVLCYEKQTKVANATTRRVALIENFTRVAVNRSLTYGAWIIPFSYVSSKYYAERIQPCNGSRHFRKSSLLIFDPGHGHVH